MVLPGFTRLGQDHCKLRREVYHLPKFFVKMEKIETFTDKIMTVIGALGLIVCAGMCGANILMWWFMQKRIAVNDEISLFGLVWATYVGMGVLYHCNGHCTMDFVVKALPKKAQIVLRILTDIVIIVVSAFTVYYSWKLAMKSTNKRLVLTKIPYTYVDIPITIGYAHLLLLAIGDIVKKVYELIHWKECGKEAAE